MKNYKIPFPELFAMKVLRGAPVKKIQSALKIAEARNLEIDFRILEFHHHAGGSIEELIEGMVFAKEQGLKVSGENASGRQVWSKANDFQSFCDYLGEYKKKGIYDLDKVSTLDPNV